MAQTISKEMEMKQLLAKKAYLISFFLFFYFEIGGPRKYSSIGFLNNFIFLPYITFVIGD